MVRVDIRKENTMAIIRAIALDNNTISQIHEATGIGNLTIWEIVSDLKKRGIVRSSTIPRQTSGRRAHRFDFCFDIYSVFVIEHQRTYSIIAINIDGRAIYRYEYFKQRNIPAKNDVKYLIGKIRKAPKFKQRCVSVICKCSDTTNALLPKDYIKIDSIEDFIVNELSSESQITLFNINNEIKLSLHSKIITPPKDVSIDDIKKIIPIDDYYFYEGELYYGVFDALQSHTINNISKLL